MGTAKFEPVRSANTAIVPDAASINKIFAIAAQMSKDLDYVVAGFEEIFSKNKLAGEGSLDALTKIKDFTELASRYQTAKDSNQAWQGLEPEDFKTFITELSKMTSEALNAQQAESSEHESINVEFAMNANSEFVRGYSVGADFKKIDDATAQQMDILFLAWLQSHGYVSEDRSIFVGKGTAISRDDKGNKVTVDPDVFQKQFVDPKSGFGAEIEKAGFDAKVLPRAFPDDAAKVGMEGQ